MNEFNNILNWKFYSILLKFDGFNNFFFLENYEKLTFGPYNFHNW